uniref:Putative DNA-binding protein n=1 Tax=Oryza sativa subsp. japonica TaxID=39947 RepID=Q9XHZ0_ORYSJ|nr:putative DNA-binding protein [Oryza sativa Japonica Group]
MAACFRCAPSVTAASVPAGPSHLPPDGTALSFAVHDAVTASTARISSSAMLQGTWPTNSRTLSPSLSSASPTITTQQLCGWNSGAGLFSSSSSSGRGRTAMMACLDVEMPFLRGIDVNWPAPAGETTTVRGRGGRGAAAARRTRSPARPPPTLRHTLQPATTTRTPAVAADLVYRSRGRDGSSSSSSRREKRREKRERRRKEMKIRYAADMWAPRALFNFFF